LSEKINSYQDLRVWQDAMSLTEACYLLTKKFPREETLGLTSQIRRASSSIAANIAEGYGRENTRPFIQFLRISQGSLKELETHLLLSQRIMLAPDGAIRPLLDRCGSPGRMLHTLIRRLEKRAAR
jgi:four helix bundle protein